MLRAVLQASRKASKPIQRIESQFLHHTRPLKQLSALLPRNAPISFYSSLSPRISRQHHRATRFYSSQSSTSFADPDRSELYYHLIHPPSSVSDVTPVFALSFLPHAPRTADSASVIGWLPALEGEEAGLNDFKENRTYVHHIATLLPDHEYLPNS